MDRLKPWRALALLASLVLVLGLAACGGDDDDGDGGGPADEAAEASFDLTIGGVFPLTGDLSQFGPSGEKALELAVQQMNEATQEAGAEINVTGPVEDSETAPQAGQQAATTLVSNGANCLVGAYGSAVTIPIAEAVASRQSVPQISPASTSPEITTLEDNGFLFRTAPSDALQGQVLADAVEQELGGTDFTLSLAARNDPYGEGIINSFREAWEGKGGQVTGDPVLYDPEQSSFNSEAGQIVDGNPDGFVIIDFEDPYGQVGAALVRTGDFSAENLFTADGLAFGDGIPNTIPERALDGSSGSRPATPEDTPAADAFDALWEEAGGAERNTFDAQTFDAAILCFLAAVAAGSNEGQAIQEQLQAVSGPGGEKFTFEQLPQAVEALRNGDDIDYEGISGPVDFDDNGDPTSATYEIFEYQDGKLEVSSQVNVGGEGAAGGGGEDPEGGTEEGGAEE